MRACLQIVASALLSLAAAGVAMPAAAQTSSPNYSLTRPVWGEEVAPTAPLLNWGGVQVSSASAIAGGAGLSLQAGQQWFARVGVGRTVETDMMSLGGGYQFQDGQALSMHVTRQLGQDRLGLAVRYDWTHSYLRLSYDAPLRQTGGVDMLRFSAGMRF
jgi:hypothetical protein